MSSVLLDTTVASLIHPRRTGSSVRAAYEPHMRGMILAVSFQTVAELWAWAEESRWGATQRAGLEHFLSRFVVVPYSTELAQTWARVMTAARRKGRRMEAGDAWIAATAVLYAAPLLTHDADFVGLDIEPSARPVLPRSRGRTPRERAFILPTRCLLAVDGTKVGLGVRRWAALGGQPFVHRR